MEPCKELKQFEGGAAGALSTATSSLIHVPLYCHSLAAGGFADLKEPSQYEELLAKKFIGIPKDWCAQALLGDTLLVGTMSWAPAMQFCTFALAMRCPKYLRGLSAFVMP